MKSEGFSLCSLMTQTLPSQYTNSLSMVHLLVRSILASGLALQLPQDAYSKSCLRNNGCSALTQYRALSHEYESTGLKVYMNGDGADVYEDSFFKLAKASDGSFTPILILVGIRLGIDRVTPAYWEALKASLQLSQSVGIAGGRPSSSHYFFGIQRDQFFYLDPHVTRPALRFHSDPAAFSEEEIDSCHTRRLRRLPLKDMDPSMLLAFLIKDEDDWKSWRRAVGNACGKPVVHVADTEPSLHGHGTQRQSAVDEVETFDDEDGDDEGDGEMVERPHD